MRYLGIDYGEKRVGLAVSDEAESFAFPRVVLKNDKKLFAALGDFIKKEKIGAVVIGLPLNFKGEETAQSQTTRGFSRRLEKELAIPIFFENEILTTKTARQIQGDVLSLDASSASLILESFLQRKKRDL